MSTEKELLLSAKGVCKAFGPTRALVDVDIDVMRGEIRGLIGENGSGKSTFSSIVAGALNEDNGMFFLKGEEYKPSDMVDAQKHGVAMVIQESGVIQGIDVTSNIFAGRLNNFSKFSLISWKKAHAAANRVLSEIGASGISGEMMIDELNFEDRKIVEIARAMSDDPDLLIVDETTTALAAKGRQLLYKIIERMHEQGKSVLFISHDLDELIQVCTSVTVLRDGVIIDTLDKENMSIENMRKLMVGRELIGSYYRDDFDGSYDDEVVLDVQHISVNPFFKNIDLQLHKGEILGLGGLSDCGMHELGKTIFGYIKPITGQVVLSKNQKKISDSAVAVENDIAYVSKDRDKESVMLNSSIQSNIVLPSLRFLSKILGFISPKSEKELTNKQIDKMSIKCRSGKQLVKELSGGNKQKVVFSKWLGTTADIFIFDCPTRGIDVGVKADMYKIIMELKRQEKSIIMISEELLELIGMSDRIILLKEGEMTAEMKRSKDLSEHDIIDHII